MYRETVGKHMDRPWVMSVALKTRTGLRALMNEPICKGQCIVQITPSLTSFSHTMVVTLGV